MRSIILALAASTLALGGIRDNCRTGMCIPPAKAAGAVAASVATPIVTPTVPPPSHTPNGGRYPIGYLPPDELPAAGSTATKADLAPFPGPSLAPPRVLWVWDNGLVWEVGANVFRWQNADGSWNQK